MKGAGIAEPSGLRPICAAVGSPGDVLLLTKAAGVEGTASFSRERARGLRRALPAGLLGRTQGLRRRPGTSVVAEAMRGTRPGASAMHDPTEGGVRAALQERAYASAVRRRVELDRVVIRLETASLCRHAGIDPLGLLGSGVLLGMDASSVVAPLRGAWKRDGIAGHMIGKRSAGAAWSRGGGGGRAVPSPGWRRTRLSRRSSHVDGENPPRLCRGQATCRGRHGRTRSRHLGGTWSGGRDQRGPPRAG
jgi:hydrogenase maturation factor